MKLRGDEPLIHKNCGGHPIFTEGHFECSDCGVVFHCANKEQFDKYLRGNVFYEKTPEPKER